MARRSDPPRSAPPYFTPGHPPQHAGRAQLPPPADEGAVARFLREEVWAPDKLPGNISILTGVAMFAAGVVAVRLWGELLVPA